MTDAELIARARHGDGAAFGELVDRHKRAVYRAALAALGTAPDAEDAAQDAFVMAFQRLSTFRGDSSFKTWLLTIAWNRALNRRRSWWRRRLDPVGLAGRVGRASRFQETDRPEWSEMLAETRPSPEQTAIDRELQRAIVTEIRGLPAKLKDALLLAQSGEYTYDEIGAIVGVPTGTIKWRVSEARRTIKKRLRERGFADVG